MTSLRVMLFRALATCTIPIEGRDEWLAVARRLA